MLVYAKSIIGGKVRDITGLNDLGTIGDVLVNTDSGEILALVMKKNFPFEKTKIVSVRDILEFYKEGVLVKSGGDIVDVDEVVKIKDFFSKRIRFLGSKVMTQKGKKLGKLDDFVFDSDLSYVVTVIAKRRFSKEKRIMSVDRILNILKGRVIIRDIIEGKNIFDIKKDFVGMSDTWGIIKKMIFRPSY